MMLMLVALLQTIPVPDVVLTRGQADAMTDAALEARLLSGVPHGPIVRVDRQRDHIVVSNQPPSALEHVIFHEAGVPAGASACRARRILVKFDTLDGRIAPSAASRVDASRAPRRVFAIAPYPLFAVVAAPATATSCAALRNFAQLDPLAPEEAVAMVDMLRAAGRGDRTTIARLTCIVDQVKPRACDAEQAIASMDWTGLGNVSRTTFTGEPLTWNVQVAAGRDVWTLITTPIGDATRGQWQVKMVRGYPAPF